MAPDNQLHRPVRVLVADDSGFMRTAIKRMIESDPQLQVMDVAKDGMEALEKIHTLHPDVVTLDIEMPRLNGLETLKQIMQTAPCQVIMISSLTQEGAETTFECLAEGAFDYIPKQLSYVSLDIVKIREDLVAKIKAAAGEKRRFRPAKAAAATPAVTEVHSRSGASHAAMAAPPSRLTAHVTPAVIAIGTSTGGPKALQEILPLLPDDLSVGVVIVQHMPVGFTGPFARRLDSMCKIKVREAQEDELISPATVLIGPAGWHLTVKRRGTSPASVHLSKLPADKLHIPSVDVMMLSVAEVFGGSAMGVILTGMGDDGKQGMAAIYKAGGLTVGQDEASCAVYGMPRSCAEQGSLRRVVPLMRVPDEILTATGYVRKN